MINTDIIINYIKENGKTKFDDIWVGIYPQLNLNFDKIKDENILKSNFYSSMIQNFELIRIANDVWDLKQNYSFAEIEKIHNSFFDNLEKIVDEEFEITKENKKPNSSEGETNESLSSTYEMDNDVVEEILDDLEEYDDHEK